MLNEEQIAKALRATRVVKLPIENPHGPLGLEQVAEAVTQLNNIGPVRGERIQRPITLPVETWAKLDQLARAATPTNAPPLSASTVAAALIEQAVAPR